MPRIVNCVKLGKELPGLDAPPVAGDLGRRIYENVSAEGWQLWQEQRIILINHYSLSLYDPNHMQFLREQLEEFFFGEDAQLPEGWTPPNTKGGKGGGKSAPAPARK